MSNITQEQAVAISSSQVVPSHNAAQRVMETAEIRQHILGLVGKRTLMRCLRVSQTWTGDAARLLYGRVNIYELSLILGSQNELFRLVCLSLITYIRLAYWTEFSAIEEEIEGYPLACRTTRTDDLPESEITHGAVLARFIPSIRLLCPNLRQIQVDNTCYVWSDVYCESKPSDDYSEYARRKKLWRCTFTPGKEGGEIHVYEARDRFNVELEHNLEMLEMPTIKMYKEYTVEATFDLDLGGVSIPRQNHARWIKGLRDFRCIGQIASRIDFGELPMTLEDIQTVYERHRSASASAGLIQFRAVRCRLFGNDDFRSLISLAGSTLTSLSLGRGRRDTGFQASPIPIAGLAEIIEHSMPNLARLSLSIESCVLSESICRAMLPTTIRSGRLAIFRLLGERTYGSYFNTVRYLAHLCLQKAIIEIGGNLVVDEDSDSGESDTSYFRGTGEQSGFLWYLHSQSAERQTHLATVDFASLDVYDLRDVQELQYDEQHRPIRRGITKAGQWAAGHRTLVADTETKWQDLKNHVAICDQKIQHFQEQSDGGHRTAILEAGQKLQYAIAELREAQEDISSLVDRSMDRELKRYLETLEQLEASQT